MPGFANVLARGLMARLQGGFSVTGVVTVLEGGGTLQIDVRGASIVGVRPVSGLNAVVGDVVLVRQEGVGILAVSKVGAGGTLPDIQVVESVPYREPAWRVAPIFTGTWRDGRYRTDVDNECRWGIREGIESIGVAYYGRALQGSYTMSSDAYWLGIVRLPSPGFQPAQVRVSLLAGQVPTDQAPTVLDYLDCGLYENGMGDKAEQLTFNAQGWWTRFESGEAGGLALQRIPTDPDHLQRAAGALGVSMTVTGYPAWVL